MSCWEYPAGSLTTGHLVTKHFSPFTKICPDPLITIAAGANPKIPETFLRSMVSSSFQSSITKLFL
jgi:hypothetical protein